MPQHIDELWRVRRMRHIQVDSEGTIDRLEMLESILFGMQLSMSWKVISTLLDHSLITP